MQVGLVGLGRMGAGIRTRFINAGHEVVAYDRDTALGGVASLEALVAAIMPPRIAWVMVPAGPATEATIGALVELLAPGDTVLDGGNSYYRDSQRRAGDCAARGLRFVDVGTSGGIAGAREGYCLMVGGDGDAVAAVEPLFAALAPPGGYVHAGPAGTGHYVKMVHNGIEYGLMQAYAEGFALLHAYDTALDLPAIASTWNHGSVVRSWLLELAERALHADPQLAGLRAHVEDSGEGRWMLDEAVARAVPAPAIAAALFARFASRDDDSFALRLLAALRREFGGHPVQSA